MYLPDLITMGKIDYVSEPKAGTYQRYQRHKKIYKFKNLTLEMGRAKKEDYIFNQYFGKQDKGNVTYYIPEGHKGFKKVAGPKLPVKAQKSNSEHKQLF